MKFEVGVEPLPQSRPRFSRGRCYEPAKMAAYKKQIREAAIVEMSGRQPTLNAVSVVIKLYRKFKTTSRRFGDADNHLKAILDSLNCVVFADDSQVVKVMVEKYEGKPKVEVEVTELGVRRNDSQDKEIC
jgi:Holliday junction resolvase RusA-like endonuclease